MGMHDVTIDDDAIAAGFGEFEAVEEQPRQPGQNGGMVLQEPKPSEWAAMAKMAAEILANQVCPNWNVPPETRKEWADALAACLDQLFPGGLANIANWGPWAKLAYASVMWGLCGVDYENMGLKPLRAPIEGEAEQVKSDIDGEKSVTVGTGQGAAGAGRHMMG